MKDYSNCFTFESKRNALNNYFFRLCTPWSNMSQVCIVMRKALLLKVLPRGVCCRLSLVFDYDRAPFLGAIVTSDDKVTAVVTPPMLIDLMKAKIALGKRNRHLKWFGNTPEQNNVLRCFERCSRRIFFPLVPSFLNNFSNLTHPFFFIWCDPIINMWSESKKLASIFYLPQFGSKAPFDLKTWIKIQL